MNPRTLRPGIHWLGAIDWDRRLFDALIPIPEGTSYNAYHVQGAAKAALLDSAEPAFRELFLRQVASLPAPDYVVAHHAEPDHSGCLPDVMRACPSAVLLCTPKAQGMLCDLLPDLPADRIRPVADGERIDLGGRTLRFVHTPWVHWPETMVTFLEEDRGLFSCDFFGSHLATSKLWAEDDARTLPGARLYYAQIMMAYATVVRKNLEKVRALDPAWIAPSHGPVHAQPAAILDAYGSWLNDPPLRKAVLVRVSTHGSTAAMADRLVAGLVARGIDVEPFDACSLQVDRYASALVDASALVIAAPAIWDGPHPAALLAMTIATGLKPKARVVATLGSYGWSPKALLDPAARMPGMKAQFLPPVTAKGAPRAEAFAAVDALAASIDGAIRPSVP